MNIAGRAAHELKRCVCVCVYVEEEEEIRDKKKISHVRRNGYCVSDVVSFLSCIEFSSERMFADERKKKIGHKFEAAVRIVSCFDTRMMVVFISRQLVLNYIGNRRLSFISFLLIYKPFHFTLPNWWEKLQLI